MSAHEYRDDDDRYRGWLTMNPRGYVINIQRNHSPVEAFLHDADCSDLTAQLNRDVSLTGPYVKVCGDTLPEVEQWAADNVDGPVAPCGHCRGGGGHGGSRLDPRPCPTPDCGYALSATGKCPSCDDD